MVRWLLTMPRAMWRCVTCGQFVGQHRSQLVAGAGDGDQAQVHADIAAGQRKGVDAAVAHQEDFPGQLLRGVGGDLAALARRLDQRLPDALHVVEQRRVVQVGRVAPDLAHDLLAQRALGADAELLARFFAQRGQAHLRLGHLHGRARGTAHRPGTGRAVRAREGISLQTLSNWAWARGGHTATAMMTPSHSSVWFDAAQPMSSPLTHFDTQGQAHMVDVSAKDATHRVARASGVIRMQPATLALIESGHAKKGDVLGVARIAAIQGAKRTADLVPLCHPLPITRVAVDFELDAAASLRALHGAGRDAGPHRRGDGGADRRAGGPAHRVRHVQGGGPRHGHGRHPAAATRAAASRASGWPPPELRAPRQRR